MFTALRSRPSLAGSRPYLSRWQGILAVVVGLHFAHALGQEPILDPIFPGGGTYSGAGEEIANPPIQPVFVLPDATTGDVVLNELMADNQSALLNGGKFPDWAELYNPSDVNLDLIGYGLGDDPTKPAKFFFPANTVLPAKGRLVVFCNDDQNASGLHTGFTLPSSGGALVLFNPISAGGTVKDSATFGPQVADYSVGRVPDGTGAWQLTTSTPGAANVAATTGSPGVVKINEWMADPSSGEDWFELYNPSAQPVALGSLYLTDTASKPTLSPIPPLSFIAPSGFIEFSADEKTNQGALHANFKLSNKGESIWFLAANGATLDVITFGAQAKDVSQGRLPDGGNNVTSFTTTPSPGAANYLPISNVLINEVLTHTDPPIEDAIELYNPTAAPVDLTGWFLSNSEDNFKKFRIPEGTVIAPGGYQVFYEYQFGPASTSSVPFTFNSAHGDQAHLSEADATGNLTGRRVDVKFGAAEHGVSFGRFVTSTGVDFVAMSHLSFGVDNPVFTVDFRKGTGEPNPYPKIGPVVINEIMYHPPDVISGTNTLDDSLSEFIELLNVTDTSALFFDPLHTTNTWKLDGEVQFTFPPNVQIRAGDTLLLVNFDPALDPVQAAQFRTKYNVATTTTILGPYKGKLGNSTGSIELYKPDPPQDPPHPDVGYVPGVLVERVVYADANPWPSQADGLGASLHRVNPLAFGNDPVNWIAGAPTAGRTDSTTTTLKIESARIQGTLFAMQFTSQIGKTYALEYRDTVNGVWQKLKDIGMAGATGSMTVTDDFLPGRTARFYRITGQ
ncbi:MAG TPA: lamin tail domain-containing protein [Verrucomicrobiae bacterium]|nr:lamin tail domain-containing protein [Verrucomicrobiae bacterium]